MTVDRLSQLRTMLTVEPEDTFLRYAIALELERAGDALQAITILEKMLNDDPSHIPIYYQLARMLSEAGRGSEAMEICETGMQQCESSGDHRTRSELNAMLENLREDVQ